MVYDFEIFKMRPLRYGFFLEKSHERNLISFHKTLIPLTGMVKDEIPHISLQQANPSKLKEDLAEAKPSLLF